jgi:hypothetical protein
MKKRMLSKGLTVAVIVLFLGIGIQPVIANDISIEPDNNYANITNIDSNICLTRKYLPLFKKSVRNIDTFYIIEFLNQIIHLIEVKGIVDSNDLEVIVKSLDLNEKIKGIHFLCLLRSNGIGTAYARGILPFILEFVYYYLFIDEIHIGPAILVEWDSPDADTYINSRKIYDDDSQKGYVFGFLGLTWAGGIWPCFYNIIGFCDFVIITE